MASAAFGRYGFSSKRAFTNDSVGTYMLFKASLNSPPIVLSGDLGNSLSLSIKGPPNIKRPGGVIGADSISSSPPSGVFTFPQMPRRIAIARQV